MCFIKAVMKKKTPPESTQLAERVGDARDLLRRILAEDLHVGKFRATLTEHQGMKQYRQMREDVLNECHATFRACFHAFYPTGHLKWWCLCDLLCQMEPVSFSVSFFFKTNFNILLHRFFCSMFLFSPVFILSSACDIFIYR